MNICNLNILNIDDFLNTLDDSAAADIFLKQQTHPFWQGFEKTPSFKECILLCLHTMENAIATPNPDAMWVASHMYKKLMAHQSPHMITPQSNTIDDPHDRGNLITLCMLLNYPICPEHVMTHQTQLKIVFSRMFYQMGDLAPHILSYLARWSHNMEHASGNDGARFLEDFFNNAYTTHQTTVQHWLLHNTIENQGITPPARKM